MKDVPIPRDIPLPLPVARPFLELLLIVAFIAHILFVNLMVGSSILVLGFEIRGLRRRAFDKLAQALAKSITVNKSIAVVLGVAPLLAINVLYTIHFYTSNALTGNAWIMLVPAIAIAFLLLYVHNYTWERWESRKRLHIALLGSAVFLFLTIPLVFLVNTNLMMFPERWPYVRGFLGTLLLPSVLPRYVHFLCASVVLSSLFGVWFVSQSSYYEDAHDEILPSAEARQIFYRVAFACSLLQFVAGPVVLFSLPTGGRNAWVFLPVLTGAGLAIPAVWMMWREISEPHSQGKRLRWIVGYLSLTVLCMASARHVYRGNRLLRHELAMQRATQTWVDNSSQAAYEHQLELRRATAGRSEGEEVFQNTCAACHAVKETLVGPPLIEIATIYAKNPDGIVAWASAPGKKRSGSPQMPSFAFIGKDKLNQVARYMLQAGANDVDAK